MKVCLLQMNSRDDKNANLAAAKKLLNKAIAATNADLVSLPEVFTYLGGCVAGARQAAEQIPGGEACEMLRSMAREHGVYIHGGSMAERQGDRLFNTTIMIDPAGEIIARYRKIHMFDVITPDGKVFKESATYDNGKDIVTVDIKGIRFGLTICYDLRFSELYTALSKAGVQVLFAPAAFTLMTGKDHWEVLCRARAIETQCYVLAANQTGAYVEDGIPRDSFGNSMIVDPWGTVIARCQNQVGFCTATLDFEYQQSVRQNLPALKNRVLAV